MSSLPSAKLIGPASAAEHPIEILLDESAL
jgi:hypothetical protein